MKRGDTLELEAPEVTAVMEAAGLKGHPQGGRPQQGDRPQRHGKQGQRPGRRKGPRPHSKVATAARGARGRRGRASGPQGQGQRPQGQGPRPQGQGPRPHGRAQPQGTAADRGQAARGFASRRERAEPRLDFETQQPMSNANASAVRVIQKHPRRQAFAQGNGPRVDFDEIQPQSNDNAFPFGHTLTCAIVARAQQRRRRRGNANDASSMHAAIAADRADGRTRGSAATRAARRSECASIRREVDGNVAPKRRRRRAEGFVGRRGVTRARYVSRPSFANVRSDFGKVTPSACAVSRFRTSSYLSGVSTGMSAGFVPLRMRSTK